MFTSIFFLFLCIFMIAIGPEIPAGMVIHDPIYAFITAIFLFGLTDLFIALFAHYWPGNLNRKLMIVNLFLISMTGVYFFVLGAYRASAYFHTELFSAFVCLTFFISGLWLFHTFKTKKTSYRRGWQEVQFLIPFCFPYFILMPLLNYIQSETFPPFAGFFLTLGSIGFLMITIPLLIVKFWGCKPLDNKPLMERLNAICAKAHFKNAGLMYWPIMANAYTAAIIGVAPNMRYVMFTKNLVNEFPPEEIEAILAHEIGHNTHRHLIFYPLIFFGLIPFLSLISFYIIDPLVNHPAFDSLFVSSEIVRILTAFGLFMAYGLLIWFYFRVIFGFFSRLFERQADLNIFDLNMPPENMAHALNHLAVVTGNTHHNPSWHHDSLQNRIDFIHKAMKNPNLVNAFSRKVFIYRTFYLIVLVVSLVWMYLVGGV